MCKDFHCEVGSRNGCVQKGLKAAVTAPAPSSCNSLPLISELSRHLATMANMTFEDVDVEAVAELSAEEVEERKHVMHITIL